MKVKPVAAIGIFVAGTAAYNLGRLAEHFDIGAFGDKARAESASDKREYREHYYPTTKQLAEDEMRVGALGSRMPNESDQRIRRI